MKPQEVSNTLRAFGKLRAENGLDVDAAAVQTVSNAAVRVAGGMNGQGVSNTLWALGKLAENGMDMDAAAVRAVSDAAMWVPGGMNAQNVSNTLWAWGKLAENGMDVDAAAVRAVSDAAMRVAGEMNAQDVSNTLWAFGKLRAEIGMDMDAEAVRAVSEAAMRVAGRMKAQDVSNTLRAWDTLVKHGFSFASIVDKASWSAVIARAKVLHPHMSAQDKRMMHHPLDSIEASSEEIKISNATRGEMKAHQASERAWAVFWAAADRWLSELRNGKRAKLESALSAAKTEDAKFQLLVTSAETDTTKVRAAVKRSAPSRRRRTPVAMRTVAL